MSGKIALGPRGRVVELQQQVRMHNEHTYPVERVAVRGPFRVLAALIFAAGLLAIGGMAYGLWDGRLVTTDPVFVQMLVAVPGMLWLLRIAGHCARYGTVRQGEYPWWPFASQRVMNAYVVLAAVFWYLAS